MAVDNKHRDEQDLERYGVWVKAGPDELDRHDLTSLELMDIEDSDNEELLITEEEEKLLGELEDSALPDFGDFDESFSTDLDETSFDDDDFLLPSDDEELNTGSSDQDLLHKIEDDLSALREEIRQLKDEITGLRVPSVPQTTSEMVEGGGFFDEEDDETIALTGDELDNILDSADMTEKSAEDESVQAEQTEEVFVAEDEEELIDLSGGFDDVDFDGDADVEFELSETDEDPALSILSSPDEPAELTDEPETIEIDIPGTDEVIDLGTDEEDSVVSIDDISEEVEETDVFEEITDLEDFGLETSDPINISEINTEHEEILPGPTKEYAITEDLEDATFDEGEEVEIDLSGVDDDLEAVEESDLMEVEMEEISLDDFGMEEEEIESPVAESKTVPETTSEEDSDVLAVESEEIDLEELEIESLESDEDIEDIELESVLADKIDEDIGLDDVEEVQEIESGPAYLSDLDEQSDFVIEEIDLDTEEDLDLSIDEPEQENDEELNLPDLEIEEIDLGTSDVEDVEEFEDETEGLLEEVGLEEIELETESQPPGEKEIPDISLDGVIDEIETPDEFSIDEDGIETEDILDLELEEEEGEEFEVLLPEDDDFNVLPGTEDVDLDSLEALAAAPDMTEAGTEDIVELPNIENNDFTEIEIDDIEQDLTPMDEISAEVSTPAELSDKAKSALELESLPGDLKQEIKDVLRYMDQLLESLPDDKIQEFARSEHFEVYKKIFEELGISD